MGFWLSFRRLWAPFQNREFSKCSAAACYYLLLSVLPSIVVFRYFFQTSDWIQTVSHYLVQLYIPIPLQSLFARFIKSGIQTKPLLPLSGILALWSTAKGLQAITDGILTATGSANKIGFIRSRIRAICHYLLLFAVFILITLLLPIGAVFLYWILPVPTSTANMLRLISMLIAAAIFAVCYRVLPCLKIALRHCLLGGCFSAVGLMILSVLVSSYVNRFQVSITAYSLLVIFFLWMKLCVQILLYGAVLSAQLADGTYHPLQYLKEMFHR